MKKHGHLMQIKNGQTTFRFLPSGDVFDLMNDDVMVNQVRSNVPDGSLNNIYLRVFQEDRIDFVPLLGIRSSSLFSYKENKGRWEGTFKGVHYQVLLTLTDQNVWFWTVTLNGNHIQTDIIYTQDLGLANVAAVQANEAYVSQYIDHYVETTDQGFIIGSRQNQAQKKGNFPAIWQGALSNTRGYFTDGFQFFGLSYKETNSPEALTQEVFPSEINQYEFAMIGLQSERIQLEGKEQTVVFFAQLHPDLKGSLEQSQHKNIHEIEQLWMESSREDASPYTTVDSLAHAEDIGVPLTAQALSLDAINKLYPERKHEERVDGQLLSFFTPEKSHVILKQKELLTERPHGHILMSGRTLHVEDHQLATTAFMYGIFNSQVVIGNTSMNKMMSNARNALNVLKTSGQRIYIRIEGAYRLLTLPSLFEVGFNYVKWIYSMPDDSIVITLFTSASEPSVQLNVGSSSGRRYAFLVTNQILMDDCEYQSTYIMERSDNVLYFSPDKDNQLIRSAYPELTFSMRISGTPFKLDNEGRLLKGARSDSASLVILETHETDHFELMICGSVQGKGDGRIVMDRTKEVDCYRDFLSGILNGFELSNAPLSEELSKLETMAWWYTYDMLVHYLSPHGLEQYGGAAWGTRDVCQGPFEFFMASQHYDVAKSILKKVYAHQYREDGNWPQWFMFDRYSEIQFDESHGDIIVWPMKALSDYLYTTGDYSILDQSIPYTKRSDHRFTDSEGQESLYDHLKREIKYITDHFLNTTYLSCYGNGDWDDTLQPHDANMKRHMASSWTVALTYQTIRRLSVVLENYEKSYAQELGRLSAAIKKDFNNYILADKVIPGFLYLSDDQKTEFIIHPEDKKTGIQYRLLPMTRSIIAELFTPEQAERHVGLINQYLKFPDGVRLMSQPAEYRGGVSVHFQRAEQAANFGREIGLMYVHAHIRYIEAMAKLGDAKEVWEGLSVINPINLSHSVKNAGLRQSNTYFSSSDGAFKTRYGAQKDFEKLRQGNITVKGGWRIYSSGPGIFMNQFITNCLGIRGKDGGVVIDPVLSAVHDGLKVQFTCLGKPTRYAYHLLKKGTNKLEINGTEVPFEQTKNRYRAGGMYVRKEEVEKLLTDRNVIDIYLQE
ncbi:GH36-type glycosyl hydrolase domain-containing protein [Sporolactobacillus kofuensis]|uniref:GH36-type glycosyl hydrolase domain-containing protein n=1 Tax=Sporolactobacillus kofuensis TaxID=269672 RepID=A0ABW1WCK6_9BACL|nr:amylo-alpha-1,6-glucosidase [Sporolactobacillus kofuensis]MCO7174837.1 cellobiose phosphorylase [Sporolactobacillus kofuensis]